MHTHINKHTCTYKITYAHKYKHLHSRTCTHTQTQLPTNHTCFYLHTHGQKHTNILLFSYLNIYFRF